MTTLSPCLDLLAAHLDVAGRGAAEVVHRRGEPQQLLDRDLGLAGLSRRNASCSGWSMSAFIAWLIACLVVSLPATTSSRK